MKSDWREIFAERAAIMEYDAGMLRKYAERAALRDTEEVLKRLDQFDAETRAAMLRRWSEVE